LPAIAAWNLAVQRQLTNNITLDIAYIGNAGRHGFVGDGPAYDLNGINIQNYALTQAGIVSQSQRRFFFNKFSYPGYIDPSTGSTLMCCTGNIMGNYFGNNANSYYNALQVKLQQNMSHGLQFIAHYTWSRALNYTNQWTQYFAVNPRVDYGPDGQNRPQVFVALVTYDLPFGKGKMFGSNAGRAENLLIGGWQISTAINYSAGLPFTPQYNECNSDQDVGVCMPNKGNLALWSMGGGPFNPITHSVTFFTPIQNMSQPCTSYGAWARPCAGTLGDSGPMFLNGPRSFTTDATVMKNFSLTERFVLQFRMDAFNLFNHRVLGFNANQGNTCIDCMSSTGQLQNNAGLVTDIDANTTMRALQFALRLQF
jgi:hypothetical protein